MRYTCSYIGGPGAGCTARDLTGSPKEAPMKRKTTPGLTRLLSRIEIDPEHLEPCTAVENIQRAAALRSARRVEA